jgi:hypothetical protein
MLFIYHLLQSAPTHIEKSDGLFVPLNFSVNILKIIIELIGIIILLDTTYGGIIQDDVLEEAIVNYLISCMQVVAPLSAVVLSAMIWGEILVPVDYTEEDDRL